MIKILIADDEFLAVDAVRSIIEKHFPEGTVVATASSGKEAILKVSESNPDLVLMDIHMPGIDGIEAIRQLKHTHPKLQFIVLTAYDFFDYAKEAIGLGVQEYLLKPIKKEQLLKALRHMYQLKAEASSSRQIEFELKEKLGLVAPLMENQFINQHLFAIEAQYSKGMYEQLMALPLNWGFGVTLKILDDIPYDFKASLGLHDFFETARILFKKKFNCLVGQSISNKQYIWIPVEGAGVDFIHELEAIESVYRKLKRQFPYAFRMGLGTVCSYEQVGKTLRESEQAISQDVLVRLYDDCLENEVFSQEEVLKMSLQSFKEALEKIDFTRMRFVFKKLHDWGSAQTIETYRISIMQWLVLGYKYLPLENFDGLYGHTEAILAAPTVAKLSNVFSEILFQWEEDIKDKWSSLEAGAIPEALQYIEQHYNETINMDDVAKFVNVSYHHFSKLFKQQTGKSFTDYLNDIRIEKSMEMLKWTGKSIKDISLEIGYNDPNYYCKIFKKSVGVTPTDYRDIEKGASYETRD